MFANMTYQDKEAFFALLDEYFESRPHLLGGGGGVAAAPVSRSTPSPTAYTSAPAAPAAPSRSPPPGRTLPPLASSSSYVPSPPPTASSPTNSTSGGAKPDMATRMVMSGMKLGQSGAQKGLGMLAKNDQAMAALGRMGTAAMVQSLAGNNNNNKGANGQEAAGGAGAASPPPAPASKKGGGVLGLVSGKSFGHVDTSSGMSAFTSMWKDPKKANAASSQPAYQPPALPRNGSSATAPPPRRNVPAPQPEPEAEVGSGAEGQAQALYDYAGGDASDLPVQEGQIVNLIEKTSADWWTCEDGNGRRGLIPAAYLKEF